MKHKYIINLRKIAFAIVIGVFAITSGAALSTSANADGHEIGVPADKLNWVPFGGGPAQMAVLWENKNGGEYAMLLKLPPGWTPGPHSHSADYHGVSLQGTWVHIFGDDDVRSLQPGSYVMQPGEELHNELCAGPEECIIFVHQHGPSDFIPPKSAGK